MRCEALRLALFTDTFTPQVNGVARTLDRLADAVMERGGAVRIFTVQDPEAEQSEREARFPSMPFWAYQQLRLALPGQQAVRRELHAFRPTLVHAATEFGVGLAGRRAARALKIPFVSSYHTSFTAYAGYYRLGALSRPGWHFLRWFHNGGLRTYCPTQFIADDLTARGFHNMRVWSRGVDTSRFNPRFRSNSLRAELGADDETLIVAYVGRLAAEKGIGVAIDAMRMAVGERPGKVLFACVGDGPFGREVQRRVPSGTWLPGKLTGEALSIAYASADLFIFPSTTDTFGNVLVEAMASGLPVLAADVGPSRELLRDDRGWLVAPGDARSFADCIVNLESDRSRLRGAGEHAVAFAQSNTWERVWDTLLTDYLLLHRPAT